MNQEHKLDKGKMRMDLLPPAAIEGIAECMTYGAAKYNENTWQQVEQKRYLAALLRHVFAAMRGEEYDEESGISHWKHALTNAAFIVALEDMGNANTKTKEEREEGSIHRTLYQFFNSDGEETIPVTTTTRSDMREPVEEEIRTRQ